MITHKENTIMILQARMGSTRLPGKSLMDLAGEPLVGRILERVKRCRQIDRIVLAIPNTAENFVLRSLGEKYEVDVFSGDENNVLKRYYDAASYFEASLVVRLPADNPVPEPSEIDKIISHHRSLGRPGFSTNLAQIKSSGYPDGIGAEIFDYLLLKQAFERCPTKKQLEHVHLNFYDYELDEPIDEKWCPISTVDCPEHIRRPDLVLDVNTERQYLFMKKLYEDLYPKNPNFGISEIILWCDSQV